MAIKTFTVGEVLTASDTNTYLANAGLVYVANATFTGITNASPLDINGVFSSTYDNYRIIIRSAQTTANGNCFIRWRTASTVETGSVYNYGTYGTWVAAGPTYNFNSYATTNPFAPDSAHYFGAVGNGYQVSAQYDISSPNEAKTTRIHGNIYVDYSGSNYNTALQSLGETQTTTQYTGLRIYPSAGSMAGEYWIYGYRNV